MRNGRAVLRSLVGRSNRSSVEVWVEVAGASRPTVGDQFGKFVATVGFAGVRVRGLEPPRAFAHQDLNLQSAVRLMVPDGGEACAVGLFSFLVVARFGLYRLVG